MKIKIPKSDRKKGLIIVDVQPKTLAESVLPLVTLMESFISRTNYDVYVDANYWADEQSMFFRQNEFSVSKAEAGQTAPQILAAIAEKDAPKLTVEKNVRSCFKGFNRAELLKFLKTHEIEEVHFVGYDINDCVLASVYDSIDNGYFSYVLEELAHHWDGSEELKNAAIAVLRRQGMTNNSTRGKTADVEV